MNKAGSSRRVKNFGTDLKDSEVYSTLLKELEPEQCSSVMILIFLLIFLLYSRACLSHNMLKLCFFSRFFSWWHRCPYSSPRNSSISHILKCTLAPMWLCSRIVSSCARPSSFQLLDGDPQTRADALIAAVTAMGINPIVKSKDLSSGNDKLNLGLVAQIFNAKPNLEPASAEEVKELGDDFAKLEVRGALFFFFIYVFL